MHLTKYAPFLIVIFAIGLLLPPEQFAKADVSEKSFVGVESVYENQKGKMVNINLYIHGTDKIAGGSLELAYDQTALSVQKAVIGDQLANYISSVNIDQPGKVSLDWAEADGHIQDGTILTITAQLLKADETTSLDLQNVSLFKDDFSMIPIDTFNGEVKPFNGTVKKHDAKVQANKEWTVHFNKEFNPSTVNKHTVMVKDSMGNGIDTNVTLSNQNTLIVTPISNYKSGTYTLLITDQVRTLDGTRLKQPVKYQFTVQ